MSTIVQFSIFPLDKGAHLSPYVARALSIVEESGLPYQLGAMGTTLEGEWAEVMAVVTRCYEALREECDRLVVNVNADYRKDGENRMAAKVASVTEKMASAP